MLIISISGRGFKSLRLHNFFLQLSQKSLTERRNAMDVAKSNFLFPSTNNLFNILNLFIKSTLFILILSIPSVLTLGIVFYFKGFETVSNNIFSVVFLPFFIFFVLIGISGAAISQIFTKMRNKKQINHLMKIFVFLIIIVATSITSLVIYLILF